MEKFEIGDRIELKVAYRGYYNAEIIDYEFPRYIVRFSSGMEAKFYEDEFKGA
jgi:hypothetical protein